MYRSSFPEWWTKIQSNTNHSLLTSRFKSPPEQNRSSTSASPSKHQNKQTLFKWNKTQVLVEFKKENKDCKSRSLFYVMTRNIKKKKKKNCNKICCIILGIRLFRVFRVFIGHFSALMLFSHVFKLVITSRWGLFLNELTVGAVLFNLCKIHKK